MIRPGIILLHAAQCQAQITSSGPPQLQPPHLPLLQELNGTIVVQGEQGPLVAIFLHMKPGGREAGSRRERAFQQAAQCHLLAMPGQDAAVGLLQMQLTLWGEREAERAVAALCTAMEALLLVPDGSLGTWIVLCMCL